MSFVSVGDRKFRVQVTHSAHDLKKSFSFKNPGGYSQFVDNVAGSLGRRVSLTEIALVESVRPTKRSEAVTVFVPLGYGLTLCHHTDHFVKDEGRGRSLFRAIRNARFEDGERLSGVERDAIAKAEGYGSYRELKDRFARHTVQKPKDALAAARLVGQSLTEAAARNRNISDFEFRNAPAGPISPAVFAGPTIANVEPRFVTSGYAKVIDPTPLKTTPPLRSKATSKRS